MPHAARVALGCAIVLYLLLLLLHFPEPTGHEPPPWEGRNKWSFILFVVGFGLSRPRPAGFVLGFIR
ncbi:MAG: hypothetical protein ACLQGV_18390 [Bryobacteraceae bacterium]